MKNMGMSLSIITLFCLSFACAVGYVDKMQELKFWQMGRLLEPQSHADHVSLRVEHPDLPELRIDEDSSKMLWESAHGHKDFSYILVQDVGEREYGAKLVKNTSLLGSCGYSVAKIAEMGAEDIIFTPGNGQISDITFHPISNTLSFDLRCKKKHKRFQLNLMYNDINNLRMLGPKESWHFYWDYPKSKTVLIFTHDTSTQRLGFTSQNLRGREFIKCCISLVRMRFGEAFPRTSARTVFQIYS